METEDTTIDTTLSRTTARRIMVEGPVQGSGGKDEPGFAMATEWPNGEGWDLQVGDKATLPVHDTEFVLLRKLVSAMDADMDVSHDDLERMYGGGKVSVEQEAPSRASRKR